MRMHGVNKAGLVRIWLEGGWGQQRHYQLNLKIFLLHKNHTHYTLHNVPAVLIFWVLICCCFSYPRQQEQIALERAAVTHHGHDDQKTAHGDDDRMDHGGVCANGCLLQSEKERERERKSLFFGRLFCLFIRPSCSHASSSSHRAAYLSNTPVANKL